MRLWTLAASLLVASLLTAPALSQIQEQEVVAADAMSLAGFGNAVAIEGTTAVVGARGDNPSGQFYGAAYVFEHRGGGWRQSQKLLPNFPISSMRFGWSVAISDDWLAVGADGENFSTGAIYMFQRQGPVFVQQQKLMASDATSSSQFGRALALRQDRLIVGAPQKSTVAFGDGAAYVFELQGSTWVQAAKLTASDPAHGDVFGSSVAIHGDRAVVGAPFTDGPPTDTGGAYLFERVSGTWTQTQKLSHVQGASQRAGTSVALDDDNIFVGAPGYFATFSSAGAIYVYAKTGASWVELQRMIAPDPEPGLLLGQFLALDGDRLLASTTVDTDFGLNSGSAYLFERRGSIWQQTGKLLASNAKASDSFGSSPALWGDTALVGAMNTDGACPTNTNCNSGSAYFFRLPSDSVQYCSCPAPAGPCGNPDDHGGCSNSGGQGAVLSAAGSGSVALDDLRLNCQWLPSSQPALLFVGGTTAFNPLGDGRLCVQGGNTGVHRFPVAFGSGQGAVQHGPGLIAISQTFPALGAIQPGEDRHFQVWYRDAAGPCGSSTNLSNAVRVTFKP